MDSEEIEELGVLDYAAVFHEHAQSLADVMSQLTSLTERMTSAMEARTGESNTLQERHELVKNVGGSRTQQEFVGKAQTIVNHAATDLNEFVSALEPLVDRYKTTSLGLFSNLQGGLFAEGNTIENREEARVGLQSLVSAMAETKKNVAAMQASISQLPALTSRFKKAKQRTAMVLGRLVAELLVT